LGRFRLAFRDRARSYLSPKFDDRRALSGAAALCIASERTSP